MMLHSLILRTATGVLVRLLLLFSLFLLLRGHNDPGGGFVGGLVAGASFTLLTIAFGVSVARRALQVPPQILLALGLLAALASALLGVMAGDALLAGQWADIAVPWGTVTIGSTLLFDIGVYLVVLGTTVLTIFTLAEA